MKQIFDEVSFACSKATTKAYSTSFSMGIKTLARSIQDPVYAVYGFVRLADEIVDSFHEFDKEGLLNEFREATWQAIREGISVNPILNSFQFVVTRYGIEDELIECFFNSMAMDLDTTAHTPGTYAQYIMGSAEVVGLMCLRIFTDGNQQLFAELKPSAQRLGSAFQKVNFLRDLQSDYLGLGRTYFPGVDFDKFSTRDKEQIQKDIEADFAEALNGIRRLPRSARNGVYLAYMYYRKLFDKIRNTPAEYVMHRRIRIPDYRKVTLMLLSVLRLQLNML